MTTLTDTIPCPPTAAAEPRPSAEHEKPVFAATGSARPRALRLAGRMTAAIVGLWLVALVLGAFGFGHIPGFQLPRIGGEDKPTHQVSQPVSPAGVTPAGPSTVRLAPDRAAGSSARSLARRGSAPGSGHRGSRSTGGRSGSPDHVGGSPGTTATPVATPAPPAAPAPTAGATPTPAAGSAPSHSQAQSHSTTSNGSPAGSSSSAPGSRSQATTAPGRQQSAADPAPGSGQAEHKPPKG
jgi:hypothetical protein